MTELIQIQNLNRQKCFFTIMSLKARFDSQSDDNKSQRIKKKV